MGIGDPGSELYFDLDVVRHGVMLPQPGRSGAHLRPTVGPVRIPEDRRARTVRVLLQLAQSGEGPLYFAAYATFLSQEEPIPARGNEVFVRREYYKLVGRPTLLRGL